MNKKIIYIKGMHCVACEKLLEDELMQVPFVKKIKADRKREKVEVYWTKTEPNSLAIIEIVKKLGYEAFENNPSKTNRVAPERSIVKEWAAAAGIVILLFIGYRVLLNLGLADLIDLKNTSLTYGVAFLVGIAASLSSCLAVVGSVVIAFSEKYKSEDLTVWEGAIKPNVLFHGGRIAAFFLLGGLLGLIGGEINISGNAIAVYTILIAVIMAFLGLNILGILPSLSNFGVRFPKKFTARWGRIKASEHRAAPTILGGLSFFLPCGFTQSMQIFALASGNFFTGALTLAIFALGTMPFLLLLGVSASWTKNRNWGTFQKAAGILILAFAFYTLSSGLAIKGVKGNIFSSLEQSQKTSDMETKNAAQNNSASNEQVIEMHVTSQGFQPSVLKAKQGVPVRWIVKGDQVSGCTNKIIVPSLGIEKALSYGDNIVRFTPQKTGEIPFSCWMGMVRGKFVVE